MTPPAPEPRPAPARQRLFGLWWRRQSPARQDRWATLGPLVSVLLFLAAITAAFWYLRSEEIERETESVKRDTEIAQQELRLRLIENQEKLTVFARDMVSREMSAAEFLEQSAALVADRPEIATIAWLGPGREVLTSHTTTLFITEYVKPASPAAAAAERQALAESRWAFDSARQSRQPVYSKAYTDPTGLAVFQLHVPLGQRSGFSGTLLVQYSVEALARHFVPDEVARRHAIAILNEQGQILASTVTAMPGQAPRAPSILHDAPLTPLSNGLILRGQGYRTSIGLISNTLFWMVVALSVLTLWTLLGTWRHMRRRAQIQTALVQETNFRRAMENSMLTGMRAMDIEGRITYVNPAFCQMTGFNEAELVGRLPPFPYWPLDRLEENTRLLQQELQGRSPAGGIEIKVARKDGGVFDARMYVSPLIDARGQQTGWVTSMTNITEAKRIRDQLTASHERFTTVLEGLDAAVSVVSVQQGELLFANRSYRLWFGADARGHTVLAGGVTPATRPDGEDMVDNLGGLPTQHLTDASAEGREVHAEPLDKWFDVRTRYLQWTDGRLAQMLIATDVTARRRAQEQAEQQAEKAEVTSRLVTMGEMASSVAHELNQPLTAITNYCNGMVSRVRADSIRKEDLIAALEKTARQAERAGQIIHRIRAFVKRSEPQRQSAHASEIVDDAVDLASIELRRRNVALQVYVAQRLPPVHVDPILIEQVVLNLLKNAAESIDTAQMPGPRRQIELRVVPRHTPEEGGVIEFSVTDTGPGMSEEVLGRLYEAFFSTKREGLGIGLSLCRTIVESHGGRMRAQNLYNGPQVVGCRFSFTLPVESTARSDNTAAGALDLASTLPPAAAAVPTRSWVTPSATSR